MLRQANDVRGCIVAAPLCFERRLVHIALAEQVEQLVEERDLQEANANQERRARSRTAHGFEQMLRSPRYEAVIGFVFAVAMEIERTNHGVVLARARLAIHEDRCTHALHNALNKGFAHNIEHFLLRRRWRKYALKTWFRPEAKVLRRCAQGVTSNDCRQIKREPVQHSSQCLANGACKR